MGATLGARICAECSIGLVKRLRIENLWCSSGHLRRPRTQEEQAADQFVIVLRLNADRKTALQLNNSRELPVIKDLAGKPAVLANRKVPHIVDDEALR